MSGSGVWAGRGRPREGWPSPELSSAVGLDRTCRPAAFAAANHFDAEPEDGAARRRRARIPQLLFRLRESRRCRAAGDSASIVARTTLPTPGKESRIVTSRCSCRCPGTPPTKLGHGVKLMPQKYVKAWAMCA